MWISLDFSLKAVIRSSLLLNPFNIFSGSFLSLYPSERCIDWRHCSVFLKMFRFHSRRQNSWRKCSCPLVIFQYFFMLKRCVWTGRLFILSVAGMSRSVTVVTAYIMTVTNLSWRESLNAVRGARRSANPNFGFQRQLLAFNHDHLLHVSLTHAQFLRSNVFSRSFVCRRKFGFEQSFRQRRSTTQTSASDSWKCIVSGSSTATPSPISRRARTRSHTVRTRAEAVG